MEYALFAACKNGELDTVKRLVESGCDPKAFNNCAIRYASRYGHLDVVKYLVNLGYDPKAVDNWAIQVASQTGYLEVVKYLVSLGCDHNSQPNSNNNLAIRWASENGHLEVVKYLLEFGCDHETVMLHKDLKYKVLCEVKIKLEIMIDKRITNKWLKMEILKLMAPYFSEWEIMTIL